MATEAINPDANGFSADKLATLSKEIFHIGRAQCKSVIGLDSVSNKFTRETPPYLKQPGNDVICLTLLLTLN
ncbi:hypothetical protein HBA92_21325 [Ochrobactrum sp. MR28]|nr:hypothetical protein [Ochrobactrum sp. MR28]MBX8818820.1 hypothetical protein [Ochrobactrum sp. MR31]